MIHFHFDLLLSQLLSSVNFNMEIFSELGIVKSRTKNVVNVLRFKVFCFVVLFFKSAFYDILFSLPSI